MNQPTALGTILPRLMSLDKITESAHASIWQQLATPIAQHDIKWRQDGKPINQGNGYVARFVCYVEAGTVRERLDAIVPGEWDLELTPLPIMESAEGKLFAFKARITILGIHREDVGQGEDYKSAATDAFKRAAVRCGIAHELYEYEQHWVPVDSDSKYAKPLEDPGTLYARRRGLVTPPERASDAVRQPAVSTPVAPEPPTYPAPRPMSSGSVAECPKCHGAMWDNRIGKKNPNAPDFKCKKNSCGGVIWPEREATVRDVKEIFDAEETDQDASLPF